MQKVLITGGSGFIGSHIADLLQKKKYRLIILDNLSTGIRANNPSDITFVKADIRKNKEVDTIVKKYTPDMILHLAGQASTFTSFEHPEFDVQTNFLGTMNMVEAALRHRVQRFLYASSMTVYGIQKTFPIKETAACMPISYYGISKYAAERFVMATGSRNDLKAPFIPTVFRMFNVYGPRQSLTNPYQGVIAIFIGNILRNQSPIIFGKGDQARDFIYVGDVAKLWENAINNKKSFDGIFNIGTGRMISITALLRILYKSQGLPTKNLPYIYKPARPGDQKYSQADMNLTKKTFNINGFTDLASGLSATLSWAKKTAN